MKKVRRRVVERDPVDDNQESTETQNNPILAFEGVRIENSSEIPQRLQQHHQQKVNQRITHGKRSEILIPPAETQSQAKDMSTHLQFKNKDETFISPNPQLRSSDQAPKAQLPHQLDNNKQPQVKSEEDEKKKRIEMLKQKYLKKTPEVKIQMPKTVEVLKEPIVQKSKVDIPHFQQTKTEDKIEVKTNTQVKQQQKSTKISLPLPPTIVAVQVRQAEPQKIQHTNPEPIIEQSKQVKQQFPNITPSEKMQDKKPFKIPPPPPAHSKGNHPRSKLPPPPVVKSQEHQQQQVFVKDPWIQNKVQSLEITSANVSKQAEPVKSTFVPPPPSSAKTAKPAPKSPLVQEILSKKLKKDQEKLKQQEQTNSQPKYQQSATYEIKASLQSEPQQVRNVLTPQPKIQRQQLKNQQQASSTKMLSLSESIDRWINLPSSMLSKFIPNIDVALHSSCDRSDKDFAFYSKNPTFNSSLNSFINQFVLKNKSGLSEGQRTSLYALSIEYFNSNPSKLSVQLLLILIKLGNQYLEKHAQQLVSNLQGNSSILLSNKPYFTNEELSIFSSFIIDQKELNETQLLYLLLIYPSEKLINIINAKNMNNVQFIIALLSCIQLIRKQFSILIGVYLKLISSLIENIPNDHNLIEVVLKHVNELQTNQKNYQLHKQIKLKLISMLSSNQNNQRQEVRSQTAEVIKDSGEGGLLGYWSKAVDKIKTVTTQIADTKIIEKPKPAEQQEEKEDDITYDPILKRYLINGKVPEDDSSRPADPTASRLPPPPPPPKNTNKPVPPPLPGKKARVATNRYA